MVGDDDVVSLIWVVVLGWMMMLGWVVLLVLMRCDITVEW